MTPEDEVLHTLQRIREALMANDGPTLEELFSDDYRCYNLNGQPEERTLAIEAYDSGQVKLEIFEFDELQTDVFGKVGIVSGCAYVRGRDNGILFDHHIRFCDVYIKRNLRWQIFLSHATPIVESD
jgi:hypothetical protein